MATTVLNHRRDAALIRDAVGGSPDTTVLRGNVLDVPGVEQAVLDAAVGAHDALAAARARLLDRITTERNRRSDIALTGTTEPDAAIRRRDQIIQTGVRLAADQYERALTADELATKDAVRQADTAATALTTAAGVLYQWALATYNNPADLDALNVSQPPQEAPEWPTV